MFPLITLLVTPITALLCGNQDFSPDVFITKPLSAGVVLNDTLCPQHWVWFSIASRTVTNYTRLEQQGPDWVEREVNESISNAVSLSVDAGYDYTRWRFTTLAVLMVNGTPPVDIGNSEPYTDAEFMDTLHVWEPYTDRETLAMGFNETLGVSCQEPIAEEIFVGIQCVSPIGCASRLLAFSLSRPLASRLPAARLSPYRPTRPATRHSPTNLMAPIGPVVPANVSPLSSHLHPAYCRAVQTPNTHTCRADPCTYVVSASLLPNELQHGLDLTARIKPAWPAVAGQPSPRHYYRMSLGPYDTLQARCRTAAA